MTKLAYPILLTMLAIASSPAHAHIGVDGASGLVAGFGHPLGGADHVLTMLAVGILAAQLGARALWVVPATFIAVFVAAAFSGAFFGGLPFVEFGIAGSVIALGIVVAFGGNIPVSIAAVMVGIFAVFHGNVHGTEMAINYGGIIFALGFLLASVFLNMLGVATGLALSRIPADRGRSISRKGGVMIALAGILLITI